MYANYAMTVVYVAADRYRIDPNASYFYEDGEALITNWQGGPDDGYFDLFLNNYNFDFQYYGTPVTSVRITTNGYITFGTDAIVSNNAQIPNVNPPNSIVAPIWDDLDLTTSGGVYWTILGTAPNRRLVIEM